MGALWEKLYIRLFVTAIIIYAVCYFVGWLGPALTNIINLKFYEGITLHYKSVPVAPPFTARLAVLVVPILPFWIITETSLRYKGAHLPFGSYLLFILFFYLTFYILGSADTYHNQGNAKLYVIMMGAAYIGGAFIATAFAATYFTIWRWRKTQSPSQIPNLF